MVPTVAGLHEATRLNDHISLGVLTTRFPLATGVIAERNCTLRSSRVTDGGWITPWLTEP
jgi:hypothetical protein